MLQRDGEGEERQPRKYDALILTLRQHTHPHTHTIYKVYIYISLSSYLNILCRLRYLCWVSTLPLAEGRARMLRSGRGRKSSSGGRAPTITRTPLLWWPLQTRPVTSPSTLVCMFGSLDSTLVGCAANPRYPTRGGQGTPPVSSLEFGARFLHR